ncbi:YdcH family protein [Plastorhodobacter daqingensis]|uniref:YdcH family protein n=1 Tax=Plastorhodobacter daqingensis TaxID=1387281 RepID=A0ABW2UKN8_9RHOB
MSHRPHDLAEEFPGQEGRIHTLRQSDPHFARLIEEYQEVNHSIHRAETLIEPVGDAHETQLRRRRLALKDEIARVLSAQPSIS